MKKHRNKLILAAFVLQILMLLGIVGAVYAVSLNGRTAVVEVTGYDPYDALRGRYLHLRNPDSDIPLEPGSVERYEALPWDNNDVYVILETDPDSGLERFSYATLDRPGRDVAYLKCASGYLRTYDNDPRIYIYPRIEEYYLNEAQAAQLDRAVTWDTKIRLSLKLWHGLYVVDGMEIDGVRY